MPIILPGETDIYALTDSRLSLGREVGEVAGALLDAGVRIIQYREKKLPGRKMFEECVLLRKMTRDRGACFIVNDHIDLAMAVGADGVHIGQDDLPPKVVRELVGPSMCIGLSTHSPEQACAAQEARVDYIGVGPIFPTQTKEDVTDPVGFTYLDWVVNNIDLPFVAIGGINAWNVGEVVLHGANCCALVSELVGSEHIEAKVEEIRSLISQAKKERMRSR